MSGINRFCTSWTKLVKTFVIFQLCTYYDLMYWFIYLFIVTLRTLVGQNSVNCVLCTSHSFRLFIYLFVCLYKTYQ